MGYHSGLGTWSAAVVAFRVSAEVGGVLYLQLPEELYLQEEP
jgi:hypothetical protein